MIRFIISTIISLLIAAGGYYFIFHKSNGGGLYGQNPTQTIQNAKNSVQKDTNYTNGVKSTVQNQYGQ